MALSLDLPAELHTLIFDRLWSIEIPSTSASWTNTTYSPAAVRDNVLNLEDYAAILREAPPNDTLTRLRTVNIKTSEIFADWLYKRHMFAYQPMATIAPTNTDHGASWKAEEVMLLYRFLRGIGQANRARIRKLALTMAADHVLLLFAPPECAAMLRLPVDSFPLLKEMCEMFSQMTLNVLEINFTADLCSAPVVHEDCLNTGLHIRSDYRWAAKAVMATISGGVDGAGKASNRTAFRFSYYSHDSREFTVQQNALSVECLRYLESCSWAALQSSTAGYHKHVSSEIASEALFAGDNNGNEKMMFPIALEPVIPKQGIMKEHSNEWWGSEEWAEQQDTEKEGEEEENRDWNLEDFPILNLGVSRQA